MYRTATAARIAAHQRRRQVVGIRVPAHWAGADIADIERELVGLVNEAAGLHYATTLDICGARNGLLYHAPKAGYTDVRKSRLLRTPGAYVAISFAVAA